MDNFPVQRYDCKIETFEPCIVESGGIPTANHRRNVDNEQDNSQEQDTNRQSEMNLSNAQYQQQPSEQLVSGEIMTMATTADSSTTNTANVVATTTAMSDSPTQIQANVENMRQNVSLTPVRIPAILDGEYFTVIRVEDTNVTVRCHQCQKLLNGNLKSTGNFLSHVKRVHPFLVDKIKCKSNQRKPAMVYVDLSADKTPEVIRTKRGYRKCYNLEQDCHQTNIEDMTEPGQEWTDSPILRRRRSEEPQMISPQLQHHHHHHQTTGETPNDIFKMAHGNSIVVEDEFDAIGRNVAAKLRNMRLDQRIIAEKLLNDILFEAQLGNLHRDSNIHV